MGENAKDSGRNSYQRPEKKYSLSFFFNLYLLIMGCFKLSDYLLSDIESLISKFWWRNCGRDKIHLNKWDKLCNSKRYGGMGFKYLISFNLAMLEKQVWRVIHYPNSLLNRVLKAKYFFHCDIFKATLKSNAYFTWKSIFCAIHLVNQLIK